MNIAEGFNTQVAVDPYNRFVDDPCQSRHGGNIDSMIAWEKVRDHVNEIHEKILREYTACPVPISPKEICEKWGVHPSDISGRFTELKQAGMLVSTAETYKGSRCLELAERWYERALECDLRVIETVKVPRPRKKSPALSREMFVPDELRTKLAELHTVPEFCDWLNSELMKRVVIV